MTSLVLDASIVLCWCFEDEATEATDDLLRQSQTITIAVPSHWFIEVTNVLALSERRGRITPADTTQFIDLLESLMIDPDEETPAHAFNRTLSLARNEHLTAYDAAYLELAMRLGVSLATKDKALADAAVRLGVPVLGLD
ncbi:MAG TPA: type II toxin-antitoxin system VapC family toxin [Stellaceae bacterium]|nr:type II toxin-antitoxin system VapC family toxin [Stellaceae bacterium]